MTKLVADENFPRSLLLAARKHVPQIDAVRVQDVGLTGIADPKLLEWAAANDRVILTHDANTLVGIAYARVARGERMAGVLELVKPFIPREVALDIAIVAYCGVPEDFENQVRYLPIR